jgi:hypothetical protein
VACRALYAHPACRRICATALLAVLNVFAPSPLHLPSASISDWLLETSASCELLHPLNLSQSSVEVVWLQINIAVGCDV